MSPPGNAPVLRQIFVDVGCYEKICEALSLVREEAQQVRMLLLVFNVLFLLKVLQ